MLFKQLILAILAAGAFAMPTMREVPPTCEVIERQNGEDIRKYGGALVRS